MKMKKIALACGAALLGMSAVAQAEWSANIGVTSNYVWRGMTQTLDGAAIQGGIDYAHESGFYAGTWTSNVDFGTPALSDTGAEVDLYLGYGGEINEFGYDLGYIYYAYPSHTDIDFGELYGSVSYKFATVGLAYTTNSDAGTDGDLYYYASAGFDLPEGFGVGATIGAYDFDAGGDYSHYQFDLTKSAGDFGDFTLSYSDNDADEAAKVFVSWGKSF